MQSINSLQGKSYPSVYNRKRDPLEIKHELKRGDQALTQETSGSQVKKSSAQRPAPVSPRAGGIAL